MTESKDGPKALGRPDGVCLATQRSTILVFPEPVGPRNKKFRIGHPTGDV
jgi:hypothetical protein